MKAESPDIQTFEIEKGYDLNETVQLADFNFQIAFTAQTLSIQHDRQNKYIDDTDFIEWVVTLDEVTPKGEPKTVMIGTHKCTQKELNDTFFPITATQTNVLARQKEHLNCLDNQTVFGDKIDLSLYGGFKFGIYRSLSIMLRPCVPRERTIHNANETCLVNNIHDREEIDAKLQSAKDYVGKANLIIYMNKQIWNPL